SIASNDSHATVPMSVTVPQGQTQATFTVATMQPTDDVTATISATAGGVTKTANLTIIASKLASLSIDPGTVNGGTSATGTVTLTVASPSDAVVDLSSNNSAAIVPATVTIPA